MDGMVWHRGRLARIVCATSDSADGLARVIVEWEGGEESKVLERELEPALQIHLRRTNVTTWI